ncbi:MAG: hypothetical protein HGA90_05900 [Alphaproteobacteria bacterium]|nr:hypothetical protein [Alphaproteobacteria bacterium]
MLSRLHRLFPGFSTLRPTLGGAEPWLCLLFAFLTFLIAPPACAALIEIQSSITSALPDAKNVVPGVGNKAEDLVFGLFIGVMLSAATYLFFIWVIIRDRGQVFLMMMLLGLCMNMASTNDLIMEQLGLHSATMRNLLQNYSIILSYIFSIFFTYYFLEIDFNAPGLRAPLFFLAFLLALLLAYAAFDEKTVHFALPTLGTLALAVVLAGGVWTLRQKVSGSLSHIIAFSFFLLGGLAEPLYDLGFIISPETSKSLSYSAFSLAAMMFAIVIAGQFAARQEEKERALAVSNERFALAARGSNEGLFDWNRATDEIFFSEQFKRILGLNLAHNRKGLKDWLRAILPADRRVLFKALRKFRDNPNAATINFE